MNFTDIRIVLVATSHPGNIGSSARALKTMGFRHLYLVTPKSFPDYRAHEMSAGADDLLDTAVVTNSLQEAIADCQLVIATSARPRQLALSGLTPPECAEVVCQQTEGTNVAIVFGREHAGLTNEELLQCHFHVNIPSNPDYSSLNLAQAVQIIVYELRMKLLAPSACVAARKAEKLATAQDIEQFYDHLSEVMIAINFLRPDNPRRVVQRLRRLFNRVGLEHMEVNILRGILSHVQYALAHSDDKPKDAV